MLSRLIRYLVLGSWLCILIASIFILVNHEPSTASILSPWQTLPAAYLYVTALSVAFLFIIIGNEHFSVRLRLALITLQTLVMHSYLALSHQFFYGADGWRHIASVERILSGLPLSAVALSDTTQSFVQYLNPGVVAYSHLWGLMLGLHTLGLSWTAILAWLVPVLFAFIVPVATYYLGRELGWGRRSSLIGAWLTLLPFALVAGGSFTLPNSLGFIFFLPSLVLLARRLRTGERRWIKWLVIYGIFLLSGYTLYAVVFWLLWGVGEAVQRATHNAKRSDSLRVPRSTLCAMLCLLILAIPAFELLAGYSHLPASPKVFLSGAQQFVGNLTGFYLAHGPRPHAIGTGNIIIYQTPSYAFVLNVLTMDRWWIVIALLDFWLLVGYGIYRGMRYGSQVEVFFTSSTVGLYGSYFLGRYILSGEQVLSRRLDMLLALFALIMVMNGARFLWQRHQLIVLSHFRWVIPIAGIAVSLFITASYSLGPVDQAMSRDEYRAAEYIWSVERERSATTHCVIADTYPLLALEALSAKRIVGGGFPIDQYFGQKERAELFSMMAGEAFMSDWGMAFELTKADRCWFIGPYHEEVKKLEALKNHVVTHFGSVGIWRYDLESNP